MYNSVHFGPFRADSSESWGFGWDRDGSGWVREREFWADRDQFFRLTTKEQQKLPPKALFLLSPPFGFPRKKARKAPSRALSGAPRFWRAPLQAFSGAIFGFPNSGPSSRPGSSPVLGGVRGEGVLVRGKVYHQPKMIFKGFVPDGDRTLAAMESARESFDALPTSKK